MKFQIYLDSLDGEDPHVMTTQPHPKAFFDKDLNGWAVEVSTLRDLMDLANKHPIQIAKEMPALLDVIIVMDKK